MSLPIIAITCDGGTSERLGVTDETVFLKKALVSLLTDLGALPILVYPTTAATQETVLDKADALLLSGSIHDIPPALYGQDVHPKCGHCLAERSYFEQKLLLGALKRNLPVLGICGGFQLINVALGGSLHQHYTLRRPFAMDHTQSYNHHQPYHLVDIVPNSLLADIVKQDSLPVNSTHHQLIADLGNGVIPLATAPDGVIEALGIKDHPNLLAVQWHPEYMAETQPPQIAILRWLVDSANKYSNQRQ